MEAGGTGTALRLAAFVVDLLVLRGILAVVCDRASAAGGAEVVGVVAVPLGTEDLGPVILRHPHEHSTQINWGLKMLGLSHRDTHMNILPRSTGD